MRQLTEIEAAVLAHVVSNPQAWADHCFSTFSAERAEETITAKVSRWRQAYETALAAEGANYKTRAQRDGV